MIPLSTASNLSNTIDSLATHGPDGYNAKTIGDKFFLYNIQTNGKETFNGKWACAKVTSIILTKANVLHSPVLGVREIEKKLSNWKIIKSEDSLKPGDIVIYTRLYHSNKDGSCTGGGTCHVGIFTKNGIFHNSPIARQPTFDGPALWLFKFKNGYRAP